jgi:ubiquitin carboxyl-terminal hydrolase 4/11
MASRRSDPRQAISSAAYILFYRRRASTPLGGPKFEEIVRAMDAPADEMDSATQSRNQSPSAAGEDRRLEDSSRGFSSAFHEAEAAHPAGSGGLQLVRRGGGPSLRQTEDDLLPGYSADDPHALESMEVDDQISVPWNSASWSFANAGRAEGLSPTNAESFDGDNRSLMDEPFDGFHRGNPGTPDDDNSSLAVTDDNTTRIAIGVPGIDSAWDGEDNPDEGDNDVVEIR